MTEEGTLYRSLLSRRLLQELWVCPSKLLPSQCTKESWNQLRLEARSRCVLGPGKAVFGEREGADTFASDGEDGVADGGKNRRERWLAEAGGGNLGLEENDFDFRGALVHSDRGIFWGTSLEGAPARDGEFVGH